MPPRIFGEREDLLEPGDVLADVEDALGDLAELAQAPLHRAHHLVHVLQLPRHPGADLAHLHGHVRGEVLQLSAARSRCVSACASRASVPRRLDLALEEQHGLVRLLARPPRAPEPDGHPPQRQRGEPTSTAATSDDDTRPRRSRGPGMACRGRASGGRPAGAGTARTPPHRAGRGTGRTSGCGRARSRTSRDRPGRARGGRAVISSAIFQLRRAPAREADRAGHVLDVRVDRDQERGRRHARPESEVRRLAPDHPAEEEVQALAGPAGGRPGEPVAVAVGERFRGKTAGEVPGEEALHEASRAPGPRAASAGAKPRVKKAPSEPCSIRTRRAAGRTRRDRARG